jgi:glycosyltransferase involved in cell wall biosynthesis
VNTFRLRLPKDKIFLSHSEQESRRYLFDYQSVLNPGELESVFVLCYEGYLSAELEQRGAVVEIVSAPQLNKPWTLVPVFFQLRKILKKYNSQVIVSHEIWNHVIAWPIEKLFSLKSVLWIHSSSFRFNDPLYQYLKIWSPDIAICTSRHVRDDILKLFPNLQADFLYHPYAKPQLVLKKASPSKEVTFIYVGRMVEYKGLADAIEALGRISDLDFRFVIVGDSQTEAEAEYKGRNMERVKALGMGDKVEFVGFQENVFDYLVSADVFVHPNKLPEPLGLVFMEALFAGIPVVATDIGGAKEILAMQPQKMGDLIAPSDVKALSLVLKKYIEDEDYRRQITSNIKTGLVNSFDPNTSMKKLSSILHSL